MKVVLLTLLIFFTSFSYGHGNKRQGGSAVVFRILKLKPGVNELINSAYKADVKPIMAAKCFNCHSDTVSYPWYHKLPVVGRIMDSHIKEGRTHIDMSKDYPFKGHGEQISDLKVIITVTKNGDMPPWYYTVFNENSKLTDEEKRKIIDWAQSSLNLIIKERQR